jgi:thioredoxin-like negative regulator of GroEL
VHLRCRRHLTPRSSQNFDQVVGSNQFVLVYFYAPWCHLCRIFYPEYLVAAGRLKQVYNIDAVIAKVDVSTTWGLALAKSFNVSAVPSLIWFVNGMPSPYTGSLNWPSIRQADIVFWVVSQTDVITTALSEQVSTPHQNVNLQS